VLLKVVRHQGPIKPLTFPIRICVSLTLAQGGAMSGARAGSACPVLLLGFAAGFWCQKESAWATRESSMMTAESPRPGINAAGIGGVGTRFLAAAQRGSRCLMRIPCSEPLTPLLDTVGCADAVVDACVGLEQSVGSNGVPVSLRPPLPGAGEVTVHMHRPISSDPAGTSP
jgi:hypothetical protein